MKTKFNLEEWERFIRFNDADELIQSLDNVLFSATIHYLEPMNGSPSDREVTDVISVRCLLEALRRCFDQTPN